MIPLTIPLKTSLTIPLGFLIPDRPNLISVPLIWMEKNRERLDSASLIVRFLFRHYKLVL